MTTTGLSLAAAILFGSTALAASPGKLNITPAEHAACDQDATTLCAESLSDEDTLVACMEAKRPQLSPTCSAAVTAGLKKRHLTTP